MIPIKDDNPTQTFPFVTVLFILMNIAVFVYHYFFIDADKAFIYRFGTIPWEVTHFQELPELPVDYNSVVPNFLTLFSSMFIHGGILHLLGNMLYLWIFGDNVEDVMGHTRFFFFFLCCGLAATFSHVIMAPDSRVPIVGASGAISGILGAYLIWFPRAKVHILIIFFFLIRIIRVSALFVLGIWFIIQVFSGLGSLGFEDSVGVAWFAHIGGFIVGMILIFFFKRKDRVRVYRRTG